MKKTPEQRRREKRRLAIGKKVEKYKDEILTEEQVIELLNDAIWLLDDLHQMTEEVFQGLDKKTLL